MSTEVSPPTALLDDDASGQRPYVAPAPGAWTPSFAGHLPVLDGLRGIAILAVLVYHYAFEMQHGHGLGGAIYELFHQGRHGVDLFFVLSGFLITGILLDSRGSPNYFSTFYARRTLRIFPLYYGVLLAVLVIMPMFVALGPLAKQVIGHQQWLWLYGTNILMAWRDNQSFFNAENFNLAHFWSLAVEEQFYLVWPLLVLAFNRRALVWVCIAVVPLSLALRMFFLARHMPSAAYMFTGSRVDALAMGALVATLARGGDGKGSGLAALRAPALWIVPISALLWMAMLPSTLGKHWNQSQGLLYTGVALCSGGIITLALNAPPGTALSRILSSKLLGFFGKYSYGLYVFHFLLYPAFAGAYAALPLPARLHTGNLGLAGLGLFSTAAAVAIAWLSYNAYEKQFLKLKGRFRY
jgi:peptidoglycan/LPS O-acetylase OafA/YrhL